MEGWVSPLLGIRFAHGEGSKIKLYRPDGTLFISYVDLEHMVHREQQLRTAAERRIERLIQQMRALGIEPEENNGTNS
jgi:tryptophanyl-tRNA synthetase